MVSVLQTTDELLQRYDAYANSKPFPTEPKRIYDGARHIMNIKGKRIRPLLALHACDIFDGNLTKALGAAHAVEVFHNFTLVHDDIMDNASVRRGEKTVHEVFGHNVAILTGDVMASLAYQYLAENNEDCLIDLIQVFNRTGVQVMEGQQWDVDFESRLNVTEEEYIEMIKYKTSVLLACSVKLGAIIAGASAEDQENMYQFGLHLGLAFQIKDDYLDSFGDGDKVGKRIGGDILNNKKTLLLTTALNKAEGKDKEELLSLMNEKDENVKIANTKALFEKTGVKEYAEKKMQELFQTSLSYLSKVNADADRKKTLAQFAEKVYYREF